MLRLPDSFGRFLRHPLRESRRRPVTLPDASRDVSFLPITHVPLDSTASYPATRGIQNVWQLGERLAALTLGVLRIIHGAIIAVPDEFTAI